MKSYSTIKRNDKTFLIQNVSVYNWLIYFVSLFATAYLFIYGAIASGYEWNWARSFKYIATYDFSLASFSFKLGPLLLGLGVTIQISVLAMFVAFGAGILSVVMRLFGGPLCRCSSRIYLETIRNTPLLIQLYIAYVLSHYFNISAITASIIALGLFEGAYISEIMRAALLSVATGQKEAAASLGLNQVQTQLLIICPQALRSASPALTSQTITLIKDSSLASAIAVSELTKNAQIIVADTYMVFEIWLLTAALYFIILILLEKIAQHWLNKIH